MFIELVDSLRCIEPHEDTWLVATVFAMDGRHIVDGVLGCPVCRRQYPVRGGVGWFDRAEPGPDAARLTTAAEAADEQRVTRVAALLGLSDPGGVVVLGGAWADCARGIAELGAAHVVLLNAAPPAASHQETSAIVVGDQLPLAAGVIRGAALDADTATTGRLESATRALRSRGRLLAPASAALPAGVVELARDASDWVAERTVTTSPPVTLRSARR